MSQPPPDEIPLLTSRVPLHRHLGLEVVPVEKGRGRIDLTVEPHHLRTLGILHGGIYAVLLDAAMGGAAASLAPDDHDVVTAQLNLNIIRSAVQGERLSALAEVLHSGRRTSVTRGEILNADGRLLATGSATFLHLPHNRSENQPQSRP